MVGKRLKCPGLSNCFQHSCLQWQHHLASKSVHLNRRTEVVRILVKNQLTSLLYCTQYSAHLAPKCCTSNLQEEVENPGVFELPGLHVQGSKAFLKGTWNYPSHSFSSQHLGLHSLSLSTRTISPLEKISINHCGSPWENHVVEVDGGLEKN